MNNSFHPEFLARYSPLFSEKEFTTFLEYCDKPLRKALRVNTLRISLENFTKRAENNWWKLQKIPYVDTGFFIDRDDKSIPLGKSIEYFSWLFYIQETSSMIPPMVLKPQKWDIVLDVSAAPWSKTTQMSIMMNNAWLVIGNDIVPTRIKALKTNINYQWIIWAATSKLDWRDFWRYFTETFDKILLDAPCSWEWTMRKDEVKWSLSIIKELSSLQKRLINSALQALKIGGTLVYSTCTMTPEEDEIILDHVKKQFWENIIIEKWQLPELQSTEWITEWLWESLDPECQNGQKIWPHINDTEWFFIAKIKKVWPTNTDTQKEYFQRKNEEKIVKGKELKILLSQIKKRFWIEPFYFSDYLIIKKWDIYQIRTKQSNAFSSFPNIQNIWIPFWEDNNNTFNLDFYSSQTFWQYATKNRIVFQDKKQAESFIKWEDIILSNNEIWESTQWQIIVYYDNLALWSSLLQKWWKLKNQVPREHIKN